MKWVDAVEVGFVLMLTGGVAAESWPVALMLLGSLGIIACERPAKPDSPPAAESDKPLTERSA